MRGTPVSPSAAEKLPPKTSAEAGVTGKQSLNKVATTSGTMADSRSEPEPALPASSSGLQPRTAGAPDSVQCEVSVANPGLATRLTAASAQPGARARTSRQVAKR